jgi:excisionase family DNA binding protein
VESPLTVREAAEVARVSESLIYAWCRSGALPHLRLGVPGKRGCIRITPEELRGFLAGCRIGGPPDMDGPLRHTCFLNQMEGLRDIAGSCWGE